MLLYLFLAALFLAGVGLCVAEQFFWSVTYTIVVAVVAWFFYSPFKSFILTVGWKVLLLKWIPLYLAIGIAVAFIKWFFLVGKRVSAISEVKEQFKTRSEAQGTDAALRRLNFIKFWNNSYNVSRNATVSIDSISQKRWQDEAIISELLTPRAKQHVGEITYWVLEWPFVIVATLVEDILVKIGKHVARFFDFAFTAVSRYWIHRVSKDI